MFSYCIGHADGRVEVKRLDNVRPPKRKARKRRLRKLLNSDVHIISHNFGFELMMLDAEGYPIPSVDRWEDTMIMSQLLRNLSPSHTLAFLGEEYGEYEIDYAGTTLGSVELDNLVKHQARLRGMRYDRVDKPLMRVYQIADGQRPVLLFQTWYPVIRADEKLFEDYRNEIALVMVTHRMEQNGIVFDRVKAAKLLPELERKLSRVNREVYAHYGEFIDLKKDNQVARLLYEVHNYPIVKYTKKAGKPSTDKDVIIELSESFSNPLFNWIFQVRSYSTAISKIHTYMELADKRGMLFPRINTNVAKTGRQSTNNPSLQNISKSESLKNPFIVSLRPLFRAPRGRFLMLADYKGIEMLLIVWTAGSKTMMRIVREGGNMHEVACRIFYLNDFKSKSESKVLYNAGKNAHFAIPYGASAEKTAKTLALPRKKGMAAHDRYCEEFPEIAYLSREIASNVKRDGYVETPFGRKLWLERSKAHAGLNYLIQGTAAGVLKRGQVACDKYLSEHWSEARMVLPIHDELIFSMPMEYYSQRSQLARGIARCMTTIKHIEAPLEVEWKVSKGSWADAKEFEPRREHGD